VSRQVAALALLAALAPGCGYSSGFLVEDPRTVAVEIFQNDSKERDLEGELHAQLTDSMNRMVHAPLVSPSGADLLVRGTLLAYERRGGIRSPQNLLLETGVRITVRAQLVRRRGPYRPGGGQGGLPELEGEPVVLQPPETPEHFAEGEPEAPPEPPPPSDLVLREIVFSAESGFRLQEIQGELRARERVLRSIADRVVLDLFSTLAYEANP
jgi:hypothetical protein